MADPVRAAAHVPWERCVDFATRAYTAAGMAPDIARDAAEAIVDADGHGTSTHGLKNLRGYITDLMSWNWLFFINVVPGIGITLGVLALVDFDEPHFELLDRFDWWGLLFMAGFLGTLEYVLEERSAA